VNLFWLRCPDFADILIGCPAFEGFEAAGVIAGVDEVAEMAAQLVVIVERFTRISAAKVLLL